MRLGCQKQLQTWWKGWNQSRCLASICSCEIYTHRNPYMWDVLLFWHRHHHLKSDSAADLLRCDPFSLTFDHLLMKVWMGTKLRGVFGHWSNAKVRSDWSEPESENIFFITPAPLCIVLYKGCNGRLGNGQVFFFFFAQKPANARLLVHIYYSIPWKPQRCTQVSVSTSDHGISHDS